ncbi:USP6 N-terminal-like protein isoform X3 [Halyomorpha halys]|uniref:USP6 N-terminal-like protein isoform X3 n=1 Tax=Halyomorpha halys TaxID=286706 RepID=UPI0006D528BD|nr:USP6 N-terminal-like protein isoform X3 [Halyomorpha halys]
MNEEELVQRAAEERAAIVAKYRHGRQDGAKIDPWEDPSLEIYHVLDRYGFIHDKNNKHYSDERIKETTNEAEVKIEMERVKKWLKMMKQWEQIKDNEKLRRRVFKGIPNSLRGQVWSRMLNLDRVKGEQSGKYQEMRELAWKWSPDIRQIDLDVNRTYRDHIMFRERYNLKQQELFNVLGAYSMYNLEIGYCQGMSQIAALLLMYLDEEDAFWALSVLVSDKKYNMHGFFIPGFPKLLRYQEHHDKIMNKFLPKLKKHLDKNGVDTGIYTLKWFFQCFLDRIPFRLTLRVWDVYLLLGERILTAMAYNLLKLHRKKLISLGMDDILQFLQVHLEKRFEVDDDLAMESLARCLEELRKSKLDFAGPPPSHELPRRPFGLFKEPSFEQKVGRRSMEFSNVEKSTRDSVSLRRDTAAAAALLDSPRHSTSDETVLPGSKFSLEQSMDDGSSLIGDGSRRSLAETSITSTADLSVFSSAPRSQGADTQSLDTDSGGPPTPTPDVLRIYVPYDNGDIVRPPSSLDNKIRILVMDHTPQEENTPIVELASPFHQTIDLK